MFREITTIQNISKENCISLVHVNIAIIEFRCNHFPRVLPSINDVQSLDEFIKSFLIALK